MEILEFDLANNLHYLEFISASQQVMQFPHRIRQNVIQVRDDLRANGQHKKIGT